MSLDIVGIGALNIDLIIARRTVANSAVIRELQESSERDTESTRDDQYLATVLSKVGLENCRVVLGGSAFNAIRAVRALGSQLRVGYLGVAGDPFQIDILAELARHGIDASQVSQVHGEPSGRCVSVSEGGDRQLYTFIGANRLFASYITDNYDSVLRYLDGVRWVHVTSLLDRDSPKVLARLLRDLRAKSPLTTISIDPGYIWVDTHAATLQPLLRNGDVLFLNDRELRKLGTPGESDLERAECLFERLDSGRLLVVLKRYDLVTVLQPDRRRARIFARTFQTDPYPTSVIKDDTGAGDVFAGGFIAGRTLPILDLDVSYAVELGLKLVRTKLQNIGEGGFDRFPGVIDELLDSQSSAVHDGTSRPKVFVVHGHDKTALSQIENVLHRIGAEPVFYDRMPKAGSGTIIEFLEKYVRAVDAIVVLMTPDDEGRKKDATGPLEPRARENVLIEAGFGVISMRRRSVLVSLGGVKIPSDFAGIDRLEGDSWSSELATKLARRLSNMGLRVDPTAAA